MLSRVADSLYWIGRYLERAENTARILDVNVNLMLEGSGTDSRERWARVMQALANASEVHPENIDEAVTSFTFDPENRASVTACVAAARESARQVRDEISTEQWQKLNRLYHGLTEMRSPERYSTLSDCMQQVLDGIHLFQGVTDSTMAHGEGWRFIRAGRYMERATQTATLLEIYYRELFIKGEGSVKPAQYLEWVGLLRSCTAFEAYCSLYTADPTAERILEFLLLNRDFPHTLWHSVDALVEALAGIEHEGRRPAAEELSRVAGKLRASLSFVQISEILKQDVTRYLGNILEQCRIIQELIYRLYISYSVNTALAM